MQEGFLILAYWSVTFVGEVNGLVGTGKRSAKPRLLSVVGLLDLFANAIQVNVAIGNVP